MPGSPAETLVEEIRACRVCAAALAHGPRPIIQFSETARIVIIGQAPGARVHESGVPWQDDSGKRLRDWTGLSDEDFYDPAKIALVPMGFCYPGTGTSGDLPPRPECAPLWHDRLFTLLPADRITLLVGGYAQRRYLPKSANRSMTEAVRDSTSHPSGLMPLPHPAWRSRLWMTRNPWFEADILPELKSRLRTVIDGRRR